MRLRRLIREFSPQIVHAHSRAASWVAWFATLGGPALLSTVHGRQHWHTRFKWNNIYGERIITICGHLRDHLVQDFKVSAKRIDLIRNIIESCEYRSARSETKKGLRLGLFGRMSGPKGKIWALLVREVLPDLMQEFPALEVLIGGGELEQLSREDRKALEEFLKRYPTRSRFFGRSSHLAKEIAEVDFVVGAGRIAVEALYAGKAVFGFGEYKPVGWVTRSSLSGALLSNFGDVGSDREPTLWWPAHELWLQLRAGLGSEVHFDLEDGDLARYFSEDETYRQIQASYQQAILTKHYPFGIPSLMFHKVVDGVFDSRHRTFIQLAQFKKILRYLGWFGKQSVTFADLTEACEGKREFPKHPVLLTFDDGYQSTLELAAPALAEHGMKATVYLLADSSLGTNAWDTEMDPGEEALPLLNPEERAALFETGVFEIGSHGLRHQALNHLPMAEREDEIFKSKELLEAEFKTKIHSFAYAYGNHVATDAENVSRAGYHFGVGTDSHYGLEENQFRMYRANVFPEDGFWSVLKKSSDLYRLYTAVKRKIRNNRKRLLPGYFNPVFAYRRALFTLVISISLIGLFFQQSSVVASILRYRNVYGHVLESCIPDHLSGFTFSNLCRSSALDRAPANVCIEYTKETSQGKSRFECVTTERWQSLYYSNTPFRTVWDATNLRSLKSLPDEVAGKFKQ